jgi:FkbM family methyltransferase
VILVDGWYITDDDASIRANPIRHQMAKDIRVIDAALKHVVGRDCVIQAGARVGLWPKTLAKHFRKVIAFEPETRNYDCAKANLADCDNVELHKAALATGVKDAWLQFSDEKSGSHFLQTGSQIGEGELCEVREIDSLNLSPDAIFLDVEGVELLALVGGKETISACRPVLVLEENRSRERYGFQKGALAEWLAPFGYSVVDRVGKDLIFVSR